MKNWMFLLAAILTETIATSALKSSDSFTKILPSAIVIAGYCASFYFLSLTLKSIPVGIAYAIWSGLGLVFITLIGWLVFDQKLDLPAVLGLVLIVSGVIVINTLSTTAEH